MKSSIEGINRGGDAAAGGAGVLGAVRVLNRHRGRLHRFVHTVK